MSDVSFARAGWFGKALFIAGVFVFGAVQLMPKITTRSRWARLIEKEMTYDTAVTKLEENAHLRAEIESRSEQCGFGTNAEDDQPQRPHMAALFGRRQYPTGIASGRGRHGARGGAETMTERNITVAMRLAGARVLERALVDRYGKRVGKINPHEVTILDLMANIYRAMEAADGEQASVPKLETKES